MKDKKILIVGGAGYIGSFTTKALLDAGFSVTVLDNFASGHKNAIDARAAIIDGSIADPNTVTACFANNSFSAVVHFAGLINVGDSVNEPWRYWNTNVSLAIDLFEHAMAANVSKFVFSSSAAVYGVPTGALSEEHPKIPVNPYGETKLAVELYLEGCAKAKKASAVALRYFNACGASSDGARGEDHRPETHLIPNVIRSGLRIDQRTFTLFGTDYPTKDGTCIRDYIHVEDLADAHLKALQLILTGENGAFSAFNVGTGVGVSNREIIEVAARVLNATIPSVDGPRRSGDPAELVAVSDKIKSELGWSPRFVDITSIVETAARWHQKNPQGYLD